MILSFTSHVRRGATVVAMALLVTAISGWSRFFHLHLLKSVPAANATVSGAPQVIRLWFSQPPELGVTSVKVTGPASAAVALAPLAAGDSAVVIAPVKGKMAAGAYTVAWRSMAKDGHVARGTFAFTIK